MEKLLQGNKTLVMGVLNVTPDSLSGDGLMSQGDSVENAVKLAEKFTNAGADILDIGGESTRPGATPVSVQEEMDRVLPVIEAIRKSFSLLVSIDTTRSEVAIEAVKRGATVINDVSGLMSDPKMIDVVRQTDVHVIVMHAHFNTSVEKEKDLGGRYLTSSYTDVVKEVLNELEQLTIHAISRGIEKEKIIIDPGIGFGKTVEENLKLINRLELFTRLGYPLLLGVSRKSVIGFTTNAPPDKRLGGSIAANTIGVLKGAKILRVHDVEETKQAVCFIEAVQNAGG